MIIDYNLNNLGDTGLLFFYASWASKCNLHLDALKRIQYENKDMNIYKINVSKYPHFKKQYNINKIPSFVIIKNNNVIDKVNGYIDQYSLSRWVKEKWSL